MELKIPSKVKAKLVEKHAVSEEEVNQCFATRNGGFLRDTREDHDTDPPTLWFVAETYYGRKLKIVFVQGPDDMSLKTAYEANDNEIRIYEKFAK